MVRDSEDQACLAAKSSSQTLHFLTLQSLTESANNSEKSDYKEVIKSKS